MSERVLVIGGGIAGQAVCEELRRRDADVPITLLCGEPRLPYDRVILSHLLSGEATAEELQLRPAEWYADRHVEVRLAARAARLDADAGVCELEDGTAIDFARAVVCTGSEALVPPRRRRGRGRRRRGAGGGPGVRLPRGGRVPGVGGGGPADPRRRPAARARLPRARGLRGDRGHRAALEARGGHRRRPARAR